MSKEGPGDGIADSHLKVNGFPLRAFRQTKDNVSESYKLLQEALNNLYYCKRFLIVSVIMNIALVVGLLYLKLVLGEANVLP